jgi:hypothetical protein
LIRLGSLFLRACDTWATETDPKKRRKLRAQRDWYKGMITMEPRRTKRGIKQGKSIAPLDRKQLAGTIRRHRVWVDEYAGGF